MSIPQIPNVVLNRLDGWEKRLTVCRQEIIALERDIQSFREFCEDHNNKTGPKTMDEAVKGFAVACREAASVINSSDDLREFAQNLAALLKGDDVPEQIMGAILGNLCWIKTATMHDAMADVCESLDDC